jgi:hypothetical protein
VSKLKKVLPMAIAILVLGFGANSIFAQTSQSVLYIPLIGITSVPEPLSLPLGPGYVTYHYAVKSFIKEISLANIEVSDNVCNPVRFIEGDDNNDSLLDYDETWRYACVTEVLTTIQSTATARGTANNITATHNAHATVVVGSDNPAPLVSIVNITKVAYPLSLPIGGGEITFTYRVNNPGVIPLGSITVTDDKCAVISSRLGDTNANNLLDIDEVWVYTCTTNLWQTTTNTAVVTAYANGLMAMGEATITVEVDIPAFPDTGTNLSFKTIAWGGLSVILVILIALFFLNRKKH